MSLDGFTIVNYTKFRLLTNFKNDYLPVYEKVLKEYTGPHRFEIRTEAFDIHGRILNGMRSIHVLGGGDLSEFWKIYKRIVIELDLDKWDI